MKDEDWGDDDMIESEDGAAIDGPLGFDQAPISARPKDVINA